MADGDFTPEANQSDVLKAIVLHDSTQSRRAPPLGENRFARVEIRVWNKTGEYKFRLYSGLATGSDSLSGSEKRIDFRKILTVNIGLNFKLIKSSDFETLKTLK